MHSLDVPTAQYSSAIQHTDNIDNTEQENNSSTIKKSGARRIVKFFLLLYVLLAIATAIAPTLLAGTYKDDDYIVFFIGFALLSLLIGLFTKKLSRAFLFPTLGAIPFFISLYLSNFGLSDPTFGAVVYGIFVIGPSISMYVIKSFLKWVFRK